MRRFGGNIPVSFRQSILRIELTARAAAVLLMGWILLVGCPTVNTAAEKPSNSKIQKNHMSVVRIELKRRNWENHGTDISIHADGSYVVTGQYLGRSKPVRTGTVSPQAMQELNEIIEAADYFNLPDDYKAPFKTQWGWWGFELSVKKNSAAKKVRFHSEDESVPDRLQHIVDKIIQLTGR